jgi:hypothetical protein
MTHKNTRLAIYKSHFEAERAVKKLQQSGYEMTRLSIVAKDYDAAENILGYCRAGDRIKYWAKCCCLAPAFLRRRVLTLC